MMNQIDLPVALTENLEKLLEDTPKEKHIFAERYEKENKDSQYYLSNEFLLNKNIVDISEYKRLFHIISSYFDTENLEKFLKERNYELSEKNVSGCFYYPPDGFMSWHTNYKRNDWRIYIVKSLEGDSFFRYVKDGEIITEYDSKGWSYRIFYVGDESNPFWHCVYGGSGRYSIGFRLQKNDNMLINCP
jgi:hypothetical protein